MYYVEILIVQLIISFYDSGLQAHEITLPFLRLSINSIWKFLL